jgi:transporter family-2 protein
MTGALTAAAAVIFGQMAMAMILDRFGAFGLPVQVITWKRIAGLVLVMAGLLLSRA